MVSRFSGFAADACSLSLQAGDDAFEALELLELRCRAIMVLLIDDRSDTSSLERPYPEKAAAYSRFRNEINALIHEREDLNLQRNRIIRHCEAVQELDECISSIIAGLSLVTLLSLLWHAVTVGVVYEGCGEVVKWLSG